MEGQPTLHPSCPEGELSAYLSKCRGRESHGTYLAHRVRRFREQGVDAEPVVFGDNRRPDAALLPYETFELLLELAEDTVIAQRVREREAADSGTDPPWQK